MALRVALLIGIVWSGWVVWTLLGLRADAEAARDDLRETRRDLDADALLERDGLADLRGFAERFDRIGDRLDQPLLAPLRVLPVVGRQMSAASHQSDAAGGALRAAVDLGEQLEPLVDRGLGSGPERIDTLEEVAATVRRARPAFEALDLGPDRALVGPLTSARQEIDEALTEIIEGLGRTEALAEGMAELFAGPADYLLVAANNAQMQNGQGMFLSAGVLHFENGSMDLSGMESLEKVPDVVPPLPLDPDLAARWGWLDPNTDLRHLGLSHRFPITADTATRLWEALGRPPVSGVVAVDPHALEAIMTVTGPVETPRGTRGADDIVEFILHDQYQIYLTGSSDRSYTEERRDELDEIARTVLDDFEDVSNVDAAFLDEFAAVASGRHLLMWSEDASIQAGFEAAGIHGQMSTESLLLSLVNRSGVKLDWFMQMDADLTVERAGDGDGYEAVVEIEVTSEAPSDGEPRYVLGPYPGSGLERGEYLGLVTLNLPQAATDSRFDDVDPLAVAGADGQNRTIAAWVRVAPGETTRLVARFGLPDGMDVLRIEPSARTHPTSWTYEGKQWTDAQRRSVDL